VTEGPKRPGARLRVGHVLARSFAVWGRNLVPFTILGLLVQAPLIAFAICFPVRSFGAQVGYTLTVVFAPSLLSMITAGAIAYGVFQQLRGEHAGLGACLRIGAGGLLRVTGVAIAVGVILVLMLFLALMVTGIVVYATGSRGSPMMTLVCFAIFCIPTIAVICRLWVAVPCAVVERAGVFGSLRRSGFLTRGARMPIFGLILLLGVLGLAGSIGVRLAVPTTGVEPPRIARADFVSEDAIAAQADSERLRHVAALFVSAILAGLHAVAGVIVYHDLRVQKEQVDVERIAAVFD
jgi:hypothetical protein